MTSKVTSEALKTNEFLRRRKLRLQQVREQSKEIAKRIRQRAQVEKLKQFDDLDEKRRKIYLQKQEELINKLEELYAKGVENVGASHRSASAAKEDISPNKVDLSKKRGKEAAAELRKRRQEKLDEQKKILDKRLQAREAANEISREKSATLASKAKNKATEDTQDKTPETETDKNVDNINKPVVEQTDMATQWEIDEIPNEWEPNVPALLLPKEDSVKEMNNNVVSKSDKSKRLDLFAVSEEMPSSLRGGLTNEESLPIKPSLTLVTEYLQSRGMRLRETATPGTSKRHEDLQSLKQTIQRTRSSKPEGSYNVCQVLDEQIMPVPSWQAERNCQICLHSASQHKPCLKAKQFDKVTNSQINTIFSSIRPWHREMLPSPTLRRTSPFRRGQICLRTSKQVKTKTSVSEKNSNIDKSTKSSTQGSLLTKKNSVTEYNHATRDVRHLPIHADKIIVRDIQETEDAYSQAIKESTLGTGDENKYSKKLQDMRSKVAMTKQNIEKEYKDTMSFLNSLPKEKPSKRVTNAFMDEHRQQMQKENRQQKLQQEFKKVERECRKHSCTKKSHNKSRSPPKLNTEFTDQDFQYSWMPVPESDASLAIHTVPTNIRESKSGNVVKFSTVDSYHEYRTRHKHTPPTKDTGGPEKRDRRIEAVIIQDNSDSIDSSRSSTSTSSVDSIVIQKTGNDKSNLSDAERIIVYKILDSKSDKTTKKAKLVKDIAKSLTAMDKHNENTNVIKQIHKQKKRIDNGNAVQFDEVREGVYKTVNEKGDNITSMYFSEKPNDAVKQGETVEALKCGQACCCFRKEHKNQQGEKEAVSKGETGDTSGRLTCNSVKNSIESKCTTISKQEAPSIQASAIHLSAATSTPSFRTAPIDKTNNAQSEGGYIKLLDDGGQEKGNVYIGTSGFLKDDAYEVVIQLRKKDGNNEDKSLGEKGIALDKTPETENKAISEANSVITANIQVLPVNGINADSRSDTNDGVPKENSNKNLRNQIISSDDCETNVVTKQSIDQNRYVDKGVYTSFEMPYAIPDNVPKTDSVPRPATSTYTQTSLSSPNQRPIFFHMSSSTSTAYMSPPEMVLPNFLRQDYRITDEEIYESIQNSNSNDKIDINMHMNTKEIDDCKCKHCLHAKKVTVYMAKQPYQKKLDTNKIQTPPNSARSSTKIYKNHNRYIQKSPSTASKKTDCKCRKCESKTRHVKVKNNTIRNEKPCRKKSSRHINCLYSSAGKSHRSKTNQSSCNVKKLELNPVIKTYVDRLLALNKEGLKAVEVAEQDCSSVSTPGSSIINVSRNINENKTHLDEKISLEQIKNVLKKQILEELAKKDIENQAPATASSKTVVHKNIQVPRLLLKKPVHKVKSFNISKHRLKPKNLNPKKHLSNINTPCILSKIVPKTPVSSNLPLGKNRSKSSPTPRKSEYSDSVSRKIASDIETDRRTKDIRVKKNNLLKTSSVYCEADFQKPRRKVSSHLLPTNRATTTDTSLESNLGKDYQKLQNRGNIPLNTATQTKENSDSDTNLIKVAEDKLQNMEKIADLTEKCTLRLSNLAKILEEVRKNKSLVYGHISTSESASDSDQKSEKNAVTNKAPINLYEAVNSDKTPEKKSPISISTPERDASLCQTDYVPLLTDIPKPISFVATNFTEQASPLSSIPTENISVKNRGRPPPALSRIHLKNEQEFVVPHELSTVLEVDSPMSLKLKNQSSRDKNTNGDNASHSNGSVSHGSNITENVKISDVNTNPDLLPSGLNSRKQPHRLSFSDSSDDSKLQMMDLNQFNDIMLKPFISFKEHAKQCNIVSVDEGSNMDYNSKDEGPNDDISSLHSDGSLPDVIAELLKRKIISEPFKYDSGSNVNSTTISSDSTLSVLALSKMRKDKKKSNNTLNNKENIVESSDTLSMSSNPDLEKAFKKLGMGWASSTLKKTKERMALSSSSNTSSSSLPQFKLNGFEKFVIPALVTDSLSTVLNISKPSKARQATESSKNAEQQTSKTNSMTVRDFLNNELAKKITFTTQSRRDDTDEEFVSLAETKMPEQIKNLGQTIQEEGTFDSVPSVKENRARTSTPVQLFKSTTYHSSSSSNMSNGLFSNADDLSSVKVTSNSMKNHSTSEKDDLAVPNLSLRKKKSLSHSSKSD